MKREKIVEPWEERVLFLENSMYNNVQLIADGYNLTIVPMRDGNKIIYQWYIDHVWKGIYNSSENEIGAKFGLPYKFKFKAKDYDFYLKVKGKKQADAMKVDFEAKIHGYKNHYPSAKAIISQLKKTCASVELVVD